MGLGSFLFTITLHKRGQLALGPRRGNLWLEAAQQVIIVAAAAARIRGIQSQGGPDLGRLLLPGRKLKALRHDADNHAFQAIEISLAANDIGVTGKNALPGAIGNVGYYLSSRHIVRWRYEAPGNRGYAKSFQ